MENTPQPHFGYLAETLSSYQPITDELTQFLYTLPVLEFLPGESILLKGKAPQSIFFMAEGAARTTYLPRGGGERITTWFWQKGDIVTAFNCFLKQKKADQSIEIVAPSVLIEMPYEQIHDTFRRFPETMLLMLLILERFIARVERHRIDLLTLSAREIKERYEILHPELFQVLRLKDAAAFLGITRETLSRLRR